MQLEICVDSVESAMAAERGGASRVELCAALIEGGLTPGAGMIAAARRSIAIELFAMIRPRGGDFCYSDIEFEVMRDEIAQARRLGADGVVLGVLDLDGRVDGVRTRELVELARPLAVTFHRAIDMTPDPVAAVADVIATGAERILTSGGASSAQLGQGTIARMVCASGGRIAMMAAGGITAQNAAALAQSTGAQAFHASARTRCESPMRFRKEGIAMGELPGREFTRHLVGEETVRSLARALGLLAP